MLVASMSQDVMMAEVRFDLFEMQTQINLFKSRAQKRMKISPGKMFPMQRLSITTKRNHNAWTVCIYYDAPFEMYGFCAYAPVKMGDTYGYVLVSPGSKSHTIQYYTAHFLKRYMERYIHHYDIDLKGQLPIEFFCFNNTHSLTAGQATEGTIVVSDHGLSIVNMQDDKFETYITYIGDDELSLRKRMIYENQIKVYREAFDLFCRKMYTL